MMATPGTRSLLVEPTMLPSTCCTTLALYRLLLKNGLVSSDGSQGTGREQLKSGGRQEQRKQPQTAWGLHLMIVTESTFLSAFVLASKELHHQRHHYPERRRIDAVQLGLGSGDPIQ